MSNAPGCVYESKLNLSAYVQGDVERAKIFYVHTVATTTTSTTTIATAEAT